MLAETEIPKILPRMLYRFDLVTLYFALIFGSYGAAQLASFGWASVPMLLLATITFLLPCVLAAYELGTLFPGEGGIYIWAHKTAGPIHGFIAGWLSWIPIFLLLPLGASTVIAHAQVVVGAKFDLTEQVVLQCIYLLAITVISVFNLRVSQNYIRAMFFVSFSTAVAVFVAGVLQTKAATPVDDKILTLNIAQNGAVYSAAVLWLLGVEVPFNMSAEFRENKRSVGMMFLWGTIALVLAYCMGTVGVLLLTPQVDIDSTTGVAKAMASVDPTLGVVIAVAIMLAVSSQDVAYMNSYSRLVLISGIEKRLPKIFSYVSPRTRVPLPAMALQYVGAVVVVLIFASQPSLSVAFNFYIAALIVVWCTALFYIYFGVVIARIWLPDLYRMRGEAVWKIPFGLGGVIAVAVWGAIFNGLAIYYVFAIPMSPEVDTGTWRMTLFVLSGVVIVVGGLIYGLGYKKTKITS